MSGPGEQRIPLIGIDPAMHRDRPVQAERGDFGPDLVDLAMAGHGEVQSGHDRSSSSVAMASIRSKAPLGFDSMPR